MLRLALGALLTLGPGCATTGPARQDAVVGVAADDGAIRVRFRLPGSDVSPDEMRRARLEVAGGRLEEVTHSPDLRTVSALWRDASGTLVCRFPRGRAASVDAGAAADDRRVEYLLFEAGGVRVTTTLPRACLVVPRLVVRLVAPPDAFPATLRLPGGEEVTVVDSGGTCTLPLPRDAHGVLAGGDHTVVLTTRGAEHTFLVGVDADGTPVATSGYVAQW